MNGLSKPTSDDVLSMYGDLLKNELAKLNGVTAKIYVDPSTKPIFGKARPGNPRLKNNWKDKV